MPYQPLSRWLKDGITISEIATRLQVSEELVSFRMKVTKLYSRFAGKRR